MNDVKNNGELVGGPRCLDLADFTRRRKRVFSVERLVLDSVVDLDRSSVAFEAFKDLRLEMGR